MVVIRLSRGGTNKRPFYHVVVADRRYANCGRYLEQVGIYNPVASGADTYLRLNSERVQHWVSKGAQATARVKDLIKEFAKLGEMSGAAYAVQAAPRNAKKIKRKEAKKAKAAEAKAAEGAAA